MSFFADSPSMLGGIQTFVASIAALIVLCLFRDKNNFLMAMISSLNAALYKEAIKKSDNLKKQEQVDVPCLQKHRGRPSQEEQALLKAITRLKLEMNKFVTKVNALIKEYDTFKEKQEKRDEPRYMSIFMFIEVIAILTFDCFNLSSEAGTLLLWSVNWLTAVFSLVLWMHYWDEFTKYYIRVHGGILRVLTYASMALICLALTFSLMWLQGWDMYIALAVASLILGILIHDGITYFQMVDRFNDKFIVKYGLCLLVLSLVIFAIYSLAYYQSWLADNIPSTEAKLMLAQWCSHVESFTSTARWARSMFVFLLVINAFIAPLCIAYLQNRNEYKRIDRAIDGACNDSHSKIELYRQAVIQAKEAYDARRG